MRNQSQSILACSWPFFMRFSILYAVFQHATTRSLADPGGEDVFSYKAGPTEPAKWGDLSKAWELCKTGQMQDPIDIRVAETNALPSLGQLVKNYKTAAVELTKDQKIKLSKISWNEDAGSILLDGKTTYPLTNIHWHAPAEHQIDGKQYELERHMVHVTKGKGKDRQVAVIAQFYEIGPPDPLLTTLMADVDSANQPAQIQVEPSVYGNDGPQFFRFMGSLTTPPCMENITWIIDEKIATVSEEQVKSLREAILDQGEGNARPLQPRNNRLILHGPFLPA